MSAKYENIGNDKWIVPPEKLTGEMYKQLWEESGGHDMVEENEESGSMYAAADYEAQTNPEPKERTPEAK